MDDALHLPAVTPCPLPAPAESPEQRLYDAWLSGRAPTTRRAYSGDLAFFAEYLGATNGTAAAARLIAAGHGGANEIALRFRSAMVERGLSPATVNRRLAAVRSLIGLANVLGIIGWQIDIAGVRCESYRDARGPGTAAVRKMIGKAAQRSDAKGVRDFAILRCLTDLALRRGEVVSLDLQHLDLTGGTVAVLGKGKTQRQALTLPEATRKALAAWVAVRGPEAGALFSNMDRARKGSGRMTGTAIYYVVRMLGRQLGITARPHGLRHASIGAALDATRGDVRTVKSFSRHADVSTVLKYDDARTDAAGTVAKKVAQVFG